MRQTKASADKVDCGQSTGGKVEMKGETRTQFVKLHDISLVAKQCEEPFSLNGEWEFHWLT